MQPASNMTNIYIYIFNYLELIDFKFDYYNL